MWQSVNICARARVCEGVCVCDTEELGNERGAGNGPPQQQALFLSVSKKKRKKKGAHFHYHTAG